MAEHDCKSVEQSSVTSSIVIDEDEAQQKCTICLDIQRDPRLLPCLHSYCKKCLERILEKSMNRKVLTCPQCRSSHAVSMGGVGEFPFDQVLSSKAEAFESNPPLNESLSNPQCSMCTEDDPATSYCVTCGKYLCEFCQKAHERQVDFCSHKFFPLSELTSEDMINYECPVRCSSHPDETLKLYCKTCYKLICCVCTILEHSDHDFGFAKKVRPKIQEEILSTADKLRGKQEEFEAHLAFICDMETSRKKHSSLLERDIHDKFATYISALESCRDGLLDEERKIQSVDQKQLSVQKQNVEMTLANIESALRYIKRLCTCPSDTIMLTMQSEASKQFKSLLSYHWDATKLKLSAPNLFTSKCSKFSCTGNLQAVSLDDMKVSIREASDSLVLSKEMLPQKTVKLGEKVHLVIEMRCTKVDCPIIPLLKIVNCNVYNGLQNPVAIANYTCSYRRLGLWDVQFVPLKSGQLILFVDTKTSHTTDQPTQRPSYHIKVTGTPQVGHRIRRGPNWTSGNSDSGVGFEGIVTNVVPDYSHQCSAMYGGKRRRRMIELMRKPTKSVIQVKWDNGKEGQYRWDESTGLCEIELVPTE